MTATTMAGLEPILFKELIALGAGNPEQHIRAVSFSGDLGFVYKANLCLRTALRVIVPIKTAKVPNEAALYSQIYRLPWENLIKPDQTIAVRAVLNSEEFTHTQYISQKTKDAICDRLRHKFGWRPNVDTRDPDHEIQVHIRGNDLTVGLNSSGDSLHKRGYRSEKGIAPMSEVLAAGMIQHTGWDGKMPFYDGMCGSGTLAIEAAMFAMKIPPGVLRERYGFMNWPEYDPDLFDTVKQAAIDRIVEQPPEMFASDTSPNAIRKAKNNLINIQIPDVVKCFTKDFLQTEKPAKHGVLVMNPPYGERMNEDDNQEFYRAIGDHFKTAYDGWDCWIISSEMRALKSVGLRSSKRITLFNGPLECRLVKFEMYKGTRKEKE